MKKTGDGTASRGRIEYRMMIIKNFEIPLKCAEDIKKFADFFGFKKSTMTKLLFVMGYHAHKYNSKTVRVYSMLEIANQRRKRRKKKREQEIKKKEKEKSKLEAEIEKIEKNRRAYKNARQEIDKYEKKMACLEDEISELKGEYKDVKDKKSGKRKRGKIHITTEQADYIKEVVQDLKNGPGKYYESDIIYSFIRYGLRELEYISLPKHWGTNLLTNPNYSQKKRIQFEIPNIFYECLEDRAKQFNVEVRDYMVILIEEKFDEDQKKMQKRVSEAIKAKEELWKKIREGI